MPTAKARTPAVMHYVWKCCYTSREGAKHYDGNHGKSNEDPPKWETTRRRDRRTPRLEKDAQTSAKAVRAYDVLMEGAPSRNL
ncbi:hypothetical protein V3C99_009446, partial [Haemonchus contortus]